MVLTGLVGVALTTIGLYREFVPGFRFLVALQADDAPVVSPLLASEELTLPGRERPIRARLYHPAGAARRTVIVVHGVHRDGYDEARLGRFSRELARRGELVLTPDLAGLRSYSIDLAAVDAIEDTVRFVLEQQSLTAAGPPALVGISFAGGLVLAAAARPALAGRLASVFSFGGHADLQAVQQYLVDGRLENGEVLVPHLYAQAVLARELAAQLVPAVQVEPLRAALLAFLHGDQEGFATRAAALAPPAVEVTAACQRWDAAALGRLLAAARLEPDPGLSPVRGPPPELPIFLLHGQIDNVIPPSQTRALALWAGTRARALVSPLISHVELGPEEANRPTAWETARLAAFLSAWLRT